MQDVNLHYMAPLPAESLWVCVILREIMHIEQKSRDQSQSVPLFHEFKIQKEDISDLKHEKQFLSKEICVSMMELWREKRDNGCQYD